MNVTRASTARRLAADLSNMAALAAALADEAVWQLTRHEKAKDVAAALGVSEPAIRKAVQQHNKRVAAAGELSVDVRTESDMSSPANGASAA